jgi:hypothetical protein
MIWLLNFNTAGKNFLGMLFDRSISKLTTYILNEQLLFIYLFNSDHEISYKKDRQLKENNENTTDRPTTTGTLQYYNNKLYN